VGNPEQRTTRRLLGRGILAAAPSPAAARRFAALAGPAVLEREVFQGSARLDGPQRPHVGLPPVPQRAAILLAAVGLLAFLDEVLEFRREWQVIAHGR
jgi:hypothetical protein